tara:strand:- start:791 stop:1195 length:405 start_codon:yes stop_codon:yes gene_type:complete
MNNINNIIYKLSVDIACLLDEPSEVTSKDLEILQDSVTRLEKQCRDSLSPRCTESNLQIGQAYVVDNKPMVLTDITHGRHRFTDGCYGFGRELGCRPSDCKILDSLQIAEGVDPQDILDKLQRTTQSMVECLRK